MKLEIDIPSILYNDAKENRGYISVGKMEIAWKAIADGKPIEQDPFINKSCVSSGVCEHDKQKVLDKIRAEIKALSPEPTAYDVIDGNPVKDAVWETLIEVDKIFDKYKAESEG